MEINYSLWNTVTSELLYNSEIQPSEFFHRDEAVYYLALLRAAPETVKEDPDPTLHFVCIWRHACFFLSG